jgi:hypothetical protein
LIDYNDDVENMNSFDVSFFAEHITESKISEMKFGSSPLGTIYFSTKDGKFITCNIEKDRGIYGWARDDTQGEIISIAVSKEFGIDVPWIAVIRNGKLFIERFHITSDHYIDSHLHIQKTIATNVFFGYDHLIGLTVQVLADNAVHKDVVVAGDGSITLDYDVNDCIAGLGYLSEMETLPELSDTTEGNTRSHLKRYSKVNVSLLDCPRPIVNGQDTYRRDPATPMGEREDNKTEVVEVTNLGWSNEAIINVQQSLPLSLEVSGIGGKLRNNKL